MPEDKKAGAATPANKRKYHSPLREKQREATREKIIDAGSELVHSMPSWDWRNLNAEVVGKHAGVSERTVHRHFANERSLRTAVLQRLVEESNINIERLELSDFGRTVGTLLRYLQSFSVASTSASDPLMDDIDRYRTNALLDAVVRATPGWETHRQENAAALLDILWQPQLQERLTQVWGFDGDRTVHLITWLFDLMDDAIKHNRSPDIGPNS